MVMDDFVFTQVFQKCLSDLFACRQNGKSLTTVASAQNWPQGYKTFFMLNSVEHEIFPACNCENANNCLAF